MPTSLERLRQEAQEIADELDEMIARAETAALREDPRTTAQAHLKLPAGHPATQLRYLAYTWRRAREALL